MPKESVSDYPNGFKSGTNGDGHHKMSGHAETNGKAHELNPFREAGLQALTDVRTKAPEQTSEALAAEIGESASGFKPL